MENSVLPQMNANQIFVWIQLVMETSSITQIANIIMTAKADYVIIIYVLILKYLQIVQTLQLLPKIQHKKIIQIQLKFLKKSKMIITEKNKIMIKWNYMQW